MTPQELTQQLEQHRALTALWNYSLPEREIDPYQFNVWLRLHPFSRVVEAIERTARKSAKLGGRMTTDHAVKFCSKRANDTKAQAVRAPAW